MRAPGAWQGEPKGLGPVASLSPCCSRRRCPESALLQRGRCRRVSGRLPRAYRRFYCLSGSAPPKAPLPPICRRRWRSRIVIPMTSRRLLLNLEAGRSARAAYDGYPLRSQRLAGVCRGAPAFERRWYNGEGHVMAEIQRTLALHFAPRCRPFWNYVMVLPTSAGSELDSPPELVP